MRQTRAIELGTGLFVLLGFAALFFLITQITSREFGFGDGGYRLTAMFEQVGASLPALRVRRQTRRRWTGTRTSCRKLSRRPQSARRTRQTPRTSERKEQLNR